MKNSKDTRIRKNVRQETDLWMVVTGYDMLLNVHDRHLEDLHCLTLHRMSLQLFETEEAIPTHKTSHPTTLNILQLIITNFNNY
jgi:hypothetical protein